MYSHYFLFTKLDFSRPQNVLFRAIKNCPEIWRHSDSCIQIEFAIALTMIRNVTIEGEILDDDYYELTEKNLVILWSEFAVKALKKLDIQVCKIIL